MAKPVSKPVKTVKIKENALVDLIDNIVNEAVSVKKKEWLSEQAKVKKTKLTENELGNSTSGRSEMKKIIMFGFNYPHDFIEKVWVDNKGLVKHLEEKFNRIYEKYGSRAAFFSFYTELDSENQNLLENWIRANYKG